MLNENYLVHFSPCRCICHLKEISLSAETNLILLSNNNKLYIPYHEQKSLEVSHLLNCIYCANTLVGKYINLLN